MATMKKYQMGGKTTTSETTKKPVKVVKKPKSVSERIGDITLRDVKNAGEDALNISTLGGYSKIKKALGGEYKYKKLGEKKNGGKLTKAKNGKSFPDLNKDGKITKADILKGRGVIAKKGAVVKKAQNGAPIKKFKTETKAVDAGFKKINGVYSKAKPANKPVMKSGGSMKKCKYGCN